MKTVSSKKQNRILLITLVFILATASVLLALVGGANRSNPDEERPPVDSSDESKPAESDDVGKLNLPDKDREYLKSPDDEKKPDESADTKPADTKEPDKDVAAMPEKAPTLSLPVNNFAIKGFSGTVPVFSYTMNDYRTHNGIDIACSVGTPVMASADGVISELRDDPMMGVTVSIQHSGGLVTKYRGLGEESLTMTNVGQAVKLGDIIGVSGDTALIESAEEAHLHFEVLADGVNRDPAEYMQVNFIADQTED